VTNFIVRESDIDVLQSAQLSLTVSLDADDCTSASGTVTTISDSISACVLDGESCTGASTARILTSSL
jgi:hypothetical protein